MKGAHIMRVLNQAEICSVNGGSDRIISFGVMIASGAIATAMQGDVELLKIYGLFCCAVSAALLIM